MLLQHEADAGGKGRRDGWLDEIIRRCNILGCKMIVVVPSKDMKERGLTPTRKEIREDAVAVLKEMVRSASRTASA